MTSVLVARLDSLGDVLLAGPAIRAVAAGADTVTLLCGDRGSAAGRLLPGVDDLIVWTAPWIDPEPDPVSTGHIDALVAALLSRHLDEAVILTSFHQSPLPLAMLLRLGGVGRITAVSEDYPGSLLDVRHHVPDHLHEVHRALSTAAAAGFVLPSADDGRLRLAAPALALPQQVPSGPYVVVHPGASVSARSWPAHRAADAVSALAAAGHQVVVTGAPHEAALTAQVAGPYGIDLGGRTPLPELAAVLAGAEVVVVPNTGPAHLAAAVGTPVVSMFAPTVPSVRWAPYGVPVILLGDQEAPCRGTRARTCPVPGHPCLSEVTAEQVLDAVALLAGVAA